MSKLSSNMKQHISIIEEAFENRANLGSDLSDLKDSVSEILRQLDSGELRIAEKIDGAWHINQFAKKAVLLSFKLNDNKIIDGASSPWFDKVNPKFADWNAENFKDAQIRAVPASYARYGSHIGKNVILMPSFVNIGAYVGDGTLVDAWATIGSCAQVGKNCHISGGVGIAGVLEPLQSNPVIIEDNCFIGARSEIAEGVIVEEGSVISMGVYIGSSTKIIDRNTGEVIYGRVPAYSVVVSGTIPNKDPALPSLYCAVIIKKVDEKTRSKTSINELLREN